MFDKSLAFVQDALHNIRSTLKEILSRDLLRDIETVRLDYKSLLVGLEFDKTSRPAQEKKNGKAALQG